jgi:hypothetical protein
MKTSFLIKNFPIFILKVELHSKVKLIKIKIMSEFNLFIYFKK